MSSLGSNKSVISRPCRSTGDSGSLEADEEDADDDGNGHRNRNPRIRNSREEAHEIDGVVYSHDRDPPGQASVYILPGDHEKQHYRASTFSKYPQTVPVNRSDLARAGFYYTGFKDRVKCFSCGIAVENWIVGDDPLDAKWHKSNCAMAHGGDPSNIPSTSLFGGASRSLELVRSDALKSTRCNIASLSGGGRNSRRSEQENDTVGGVTRILEQVNITGQHLRLETVVDYDHRIYLLSLDLRIEENRRKTFRKWPSYPAPLLPSLLAKEGFFYLGNSDRTQCFVCFGVLRNWAPADNVRAEHRRHFSQCRFVLDELTGNITMSERQRSEADDADRLRMNQLLPSDHGDITEPPDPSAEEENTLSVSFPCQNSTSPHMKLLNSRLQSFDDRWPRTVMRATVEQIAKAGFFYLGVRDKTKCWYCNGGLQNWDYNDEPWTEHAKWFPGCEFVIRRKGPDFVRRLVAEHPNLNRPAIRNAVSYGIIRGQADEVSHFNTHAPREIPAELNIQEVKKMGFSIRKIHLALERRRAQGRDYQDTLDLIEDLLNENESENESPMFQEPTGATAANVVGVPIQETSGSRNKLEHGEVAKKTLTQSPSRLNNQRVDADTELATALRLIRETELCRNCQRNGVEYVCLPCGHMGACSNCAEGMKKCFICHVAVEKTVKVYRA